MSDYIYGKNPIFEALKSNRKIESLYLQENIKSKSIEKIIHLAQQQNIQINRITRTAMVKLVRHNHHQGIVAQVADYDYWTLEALLTRAFNNGKEPILAILDSIQDPHNLGAIIRSADGAGLDGIIIPKYNAVGVNPTVIKSAAGATAHIKIARVTNLAKAMDSLKQAGFWIAGTTADGDKSFFDLDYTGPLAIVLGSEGKGMRRLVQEKCDYLLQIPMFGKVNSLNVSVSAALLFFQARFQRETDV